MRNDLVIKALIGGVVLNFVFPSTYNGDFITKPMFSAGNPYLIFVYAVLLFIFFSVVSSKDLTNKGKIEIDKPKEIPKTIVRSVLELLFGIIFLLIVPVIGSLLLYWGLNLSGKVAILIFFAYIVILVAIIKKTYWSKLYK